MFKSKAINTLCYIVLAVKAQVRNVSRSTEGLHSQVSHILRRAPAARTPYISFELRHKELFEMAAHNPIVPHLLTA